MKKICFTGYRPFKLPFIIDSRDGDYMNFYKRAEKLILSQIEAGNRYFISGMAQGSDIILAEIVLSFKKIYSGVYLECAVPFPGQSGAWDGECREKYAAALKLCDKLTVIDKNYSSGSFMKRNRYMVDSSDIVIAVYDGKKGGTKFTHDYAVKKGKQVIILSPSKNETCIQTEII